MTFDTKHFLELTLLLSASACARGQAQPQKPVAALTPSPQRYDVPPPPAPPELPAELTSAAPAEPTSCNDTGSLTACDLLNPACEGGEAAWCRDPETGLRTKIREGFAECVKKAQRGRCAPASAARKCLKQTISKGCIDPEAERTCQTLLSECSAAGKKPQYDLATCSKIVSAVAAKRGTPGWQAQNLDLLGPTAEGRSCALDYVLNYYPFGK